MILIIAFCVCFFTPIICLFVCFLFGTKEIIDTSEYSKPNLIKVYYYNNKGCKNE
jgi:hypothetical protein